MDLDGTSHPDAQTTPPPPLYHVRFDGRIGETPLPVLPLLLQICGDLGFLIQA
jgi:hypothetical protein